MSDKKVYRPKDVKMKMTEGSSNVEGPKRCYVPWQISAECPECGEELWWDGNEQYLSYPVAGEVEEIVLYCEPCDGAGHPSYGEWRVPVLFNYSLELVEDDI